MEMKLFDSPNYMYTINKLKFSFDWNYNKKNCRKRLWYNKGLLKDSSKNITSIAVSSNDQSVLMNPFDWSFLTSD